MSATYERLIITAASSGYADALLALLGSLNCNWPGHPPVLVYDLGLPPPLLEKLQECGVLVRSVPVFCPHWREDFTWKPWCFLDAPADTYLWIDAGMCVLRPLWETFIGAEHLGYFAVALYNHPVAPSVPEPLIRNAKIEKGELDEMVSISSGLHALHKQGRGLALVEEAVQLALQHENMEATRPEHRHDQALMTILLNKYFGPLILADYHVYCHHYPDGPGVESRQKVWVHRRKMTREDQEFFLRYVGRPGPRHLPRKRVERPPDPGLLMRARIAIAKLRRRYPGDDLEDSSKDVFHGLRD